MYRFLPYAIFYIVVMSLQIFVIDKLTLNVALAPLIYIGFVALLPMKNSQLKMLLIGFIVGVVADLTMGMAGVNTIATTFVAYTRYYILLATMGRDAISAGGSPLMDKKGAGRFLRYLICVVLLHHTILFLVESLDFTPGGFAIYRTLLSSAVSVLFITILSMLFGPVLSSRK